MSLTKTDLQTIQAVLQETFTSFDINGIFVNNNDNNYSNTEDAPANDENDNHPSSSSSIDVLLPESEINTFTLEELVDDLSIFSTQTGKSSPSSSLLSSSFFPCSFAEIWRSIITLPKSPSLFASIRTFFALCRFQRDPRCLRFRESVRLERIFERKLFEDPKTFKLFDILMTQSGIINSNNNSTASCANANNNTRITSRMAEAWLTVLDYYFFYFPEFRFPVPDGQAADYSKRIHRPMNMFFMYTRIRKQVAAQAGSSGNNSSSDSSSSSISSSSSSICDKASFISHLKLIAANCIAYNGKQSWLAQRAGELTDTSSLREATNHIAPHLLKIVGKKTGGNKQQQSSMNDNDEKSLLGPGEDFSVRWFNESLKPGQFVIPSASVDVESKKTRTRTKNTVSERKKNKLPITKKVSGKRRQRDEEDDNDDSSSSSDSDETTSTDTSSSSSYVHREGAVSTKGNKNNKTATVASSSKTSKQQNSTKSSSKSHRHAKQTTPAVNLQDVHSTLLAIWSSVTDQHIPKSEAIISAIENKKQKQKQQNSNNNELTTNSRGQTISPSIRRSINNNNTTSLSMMRMSQARDNNNTSTEHGSYFTKESIQELAALKALSDMVDGQLKVLQ